MGTNPSNQDAYDNAISPRSDEKENLYTEDNLLMTPFTFDLAEKLTRGRSQKKATDWTSENENKSSWFCIKNWIKNKLFPQKS
jgi:hypothetical protein